MMKHTIRKIYMVVALIIGLLPIMGVIGSPHKAGAVAASDWNASRIIDDSVFYNPHSMSTQEIQNFLNAKVPVCSTNHAPSSNPNDSGPPYICLKDYSQNVPNMPADAYCGVINGGSKSAATIIKEVSNACNINPQVLLVLLQKEQSLVTDTWPWQIQYAKATGFGCPDNAPCDSGFAGFFYQVYYAGRQFQRYIKLPNQYNYAVGRNSFVSYQANNPGCGGTYITPQTQATSALYNYTPYQPNQAALNNLYGTGDGCSAYGNRNFWRLFWDWFGNPTGARYAWLIENFSYSGGDNSISTGQTETLTLKARNVGRVPWYNHGANPVRLGGYQPENRNSSLFGTNRMATMSESVVQPNEIATFTWQLSPGTRGTFIEPMNLVAENSEWMSWPGFSPTIQVTGPYNWRIDDVIYHNGTGLMEPGQLQLITVKARNIGSTTWYKGGSSPLRLGTWTPQRVSPVTHNWLSETRIDMNEASVAPGEVAGFQFYVRMPATGTFYERFNLVAEGLTWLDDQGLTLYLQGKTLEWQALWHTHTAGTALMGPGETQEIILKVRNTGAVTWQRDGPNPVRLATVSPQDRGSAFYNTTWLRDTRPASLIEQSVAPGQEGTFKFIVKAPSTKGPWYERVSLISENRAWLNDPGFNVYFKVI